MPFRVEGYVSTEMFCPLLMGANAIFETILADSEGSRYRALRKDELIPDGGCLGMTCMMWRYEKSQTAYSGEDAGYCGLAGRPLPWAEDAI